MTDIKELLADLSARLPELEWKITSLGAVFSSQKVPRGLFRASNEMTGPGCVIEIKEDIQALYHQKNQRSAVYLAQQIQRKVNVLVALCQNYTHENRPEERTYFGVNAITTRQQRIEFLETEVETLTIQQQALLQTLAKMKTNECTLAVLNVQSELGEVEKRLTLAKESLSQTLG